MSDHETRLTVAEENIQGKTTFKILWKIVTQQYRHEILDISSVYDTTNSFECDCNIFFLLPPKKFRERNVFTNLCLFPGEGVYPWFHVPSTGYAFFQDPSRSTPGGRGLPQGVGILGMHT